VFVYNRYNMRKILFILVIFLAAALVYLSFGEIETIVETVQQGEMRYIIIGLLIQCGWFLNLGLTYLSLFRLLGLEGTISRLTLMSIAATFVNIVAPTGGMGGMAIFISDARRHNQSPGKVTIAGVLSVFLDYIAFLVILTLGLIVLFRRGNIGPTESIASALMFTAACTLGFLLYLGSKSAEKLGNALAWMARLVNRIVRPFIHRDYILEARAHEIAYEISTDLSLLPERYRSLIKPMFLAFINKALLISILLCCFLAFQVPFSPGTIIGGFAISYLFLIVSFTPSGIGIVEGVMPLALSSLKVEWSQAVIITLAYRGITFWFPLGIGAIAFRMIDRKD
jgi:glycosyltransferase 2 family protein